ncbi:MAG: VanZ like protein RDD [Tissierellia bacterium]|nr:VanZ like protein RDD [Tissierellia bacterium]
MSTYITPIIYGFIGFMFILYMTIIPYMIHNYRVNGKVALSKTVVYYSFVLYILTAFLMTLLPLPSIEKVAQMTTPKYNLRSFSFVFEFMEKSGFSIDNPSSIVKALRHPTFYTAAFNVLLTLPFGIYLRKYFKFSLLKTVFAGFLLSLFFEITQLTGIYGIYPRPYRLFDVDDLILNTLGATFGYLLTPIIGVVLPKKVEDTVDITGVVSYPRRFVALIVDLFILNMSFGAGVDILKFSNTSFPQSDLIVMIFSSYILFGVVPYILNGTTLGRAIVKIRTVSTNSKYIKLSQLIIRNGILLLILRFLPIYVSSLTNPENIFTIVITLSTAIITLIFYVYAFIKVIRKKRVLFYEKISHTKEIPY